jgi:uncharacterized membrane protein YvbJ
MAQKEMIMKKCPYCCAEIETQALKCKHCGEWVEQPPHRNQMNNPNNDTPSGWAKSFMKSDDLDKTLNEGVKLYAGWKIISAIIGAIIFLFFFFGLFLPQFNKVNSGFESFHPSSAPSFNFHR